MFNQADSVVSLMQQIQTNLFETAESYLNQAHQIASILGATGTDLDTIASRFGIIRVAGQTDAQLLSQIGNSLNFSVNKPSIIQTASYLSQQIQIYEPAGGSAIDWNPLTNFRYDRQAVTGTFTRNSVAYNSSFTVYSANAPIWEAQNSMYWLAVIEGTTNLFTSADSQSFSAAYTSGTLNGTYTVSIRGTSGSLVLSGGATGTVNAGQYLTFTVSSATVTFTPTGTPTYCQLEALSYQTPWVIGGTTRDAETYTLPASVVGTQSQGLIMVAVDNNAWCALPNTSFMSPGLYTSSAVRSQYIFDYNGQLAVWYDGSEWNFLIGGVTLTSGSVEYGLGLHCVVANWGNGVAELIVDGVVVVSGTASGPTSVSGSIYFGSDHTGANQIDGFIGNIQCLESWWPSSRINTLAASVATPVYAQSLFSGGFFSQSVNGVAGGMQFGVANYVGLYVQTSGSTTSGFSLDISTLDVNYMQGSSGQNMSVLKLALFPLFAAGKKIFLWQPGQIT